MQQISSGQRGRHYLRNFLEMRRKTCRKKFRNGAQKKVPESAGLAGTSRPRLESPGHVLAQTRFPSWAQKIKNGPKWVQNRRFGLKIGPRESYGHFRPVRTGPGPKKFKGMPRKRQVSLSTKLSTTNHLKFNADMLKFGNVDSAMDSELLAPTMISV